MEILAVIPARGGSKGLPRKNVLPLCGHPLISYSIKAALDSKLVSRTIVNTDAEYIANEARKYGAELPFLRPSELAEDFSTDYEVFSHMIEWLKEHEDYTPQLIVQLRPTSPIRPNGIIDRCIERMMNSDADSLRIVTKTPITPYKMWQLSNENEPMRPLLEIEGLEEPFNQPRQKLPEIYWQVGCLDIIRTETITKLKTMSGKKILPCVIEQRFAVDIDDIDAFAKAEKVLLSEDCVRF